MNTLHIRAAATKGLRAYNTTGAQGRVLKGWKWIEQGASRGSAYSYATELRALAGACRARKVDVIATLDDFTKHYLIAAMWSSNDESTPSGGEPIDNNYDLWDLTPEALETAWQDCQKFQMDNAADLAAAYEQYDELGYSAHPDAGSAQACAGHDFWLSRAGHGTGFWDRGLSNGEALFAACEKFPALDLYVQGGTVGME